MWGGGGRKSWSWSSLNGKQLLIGMGEEVRVREDALLPSPGFKGTAARASERRTRQKRSDGSKPAEAETRRVTSNESNETGKKYRTQAKRQEVIIIKQNKKQLGFLKYQL